MQIFEGTKTVHSWEFITFFASKKSPPHVIIDALAIYSKTAAAAATSNFKLCLNWQIYTRIYMAAEWSDGASH